MHRCVIYPPSVLPIFHFGSSLPHRPPPSFPFSTPVLYPVRSQGKLLSSCPLTTARPETWEGSFFLYCNCCYGSYMFMAHRDNRIQNLHQYKFFHNWCRFSIKALHPFWHTKINKHKTCVNCKKTYIHFTFLFPHKTMIFQKMLLSPWHFPIYLCMHL